MAGILHWPERDTGTKERSDELVQKEFGQFQPAEVWLARPETQDRSSPGSFAAWEQGNAGWMVRGLATRR